MPKQSLLAAARLFFGLLTFAALIRSFLYSVVQSGNSPVNFFSYFTILTNLFVAIVLTVSAINLIRRKVPTETGDILRGSATVSISIVGIVFGLLLSQMDSGMIPWTNFVAHYLMPVVMVLDWLNQPQKQRSFPGTSGTGSSTPSPTSSTPSSAEPSPTGTPTGSSTPTNHPPAGPVSSSSPPPSPSAFCSSASRSSGLGINSNATSSEVGD